jgi:hypothetical protein
MRIMDLVLALRNLPLDPIRTISFSAPPPKPQTSTGYHRIPSPTAAVKVSPIALGGISIGSAWSELFGQNEDLFTLLDTFFSLGGNFIDT